MGDAVWTGIRVWYPPNDPAGAYYRTKYIGEKVNTKKRIVIVTMELIPEER